ncbi:hypothetical protein [Desulfonatronum thioautotrophicum]|uniref:hypothetical protein n=1 Tax=Desulfonatronum thioautotrophicum TaxID=617001 RepID=UPI0005EB447C|nr:hypothetical protein [Desulfonatronum thioautotrophicum]
MGYYHEHSAVSVSLDEHVKMLGDEDLMDFWEESQFMEGFFHEHDFSPDVPVQNYERLILQELQLRFCQRGQPFAIQPQIQTPCPF